MKCNALFTWQSIFKQFEPRKGRELYINDISSSTTNSPRLFAGNTCLILQDKDINTLHKKLTAETSSVRNWMAANKLTLNVTKPNVIVVEPNTRNRK